MNGRHFDNALEELNSKIHLGHQLLRGAEVRTQRLQQSVNHDRQQQQQHIQRLEKELDQQRHENAMLASRQGTLEIYNNSIKMLHQSSLDKIGKLVDGMASMYEVIDDPSFVDSLVRQGQGTRREDLYRACMMNMLEELFEKHNISSRNPLYQKMNSGQVIDSAVAVRNQHLVAQRQRVALLLGIKTGLPDVSQGGTSSEIVTDKGSSETIGGASASKALVPMSKTTGVLSGPQPDVKENKEQNTPASGKPGSGIRRSESTRESHTEPDHFKHQRQSSKVGQHQPKSKGIVQNTREMRSASTSAVARLPGAAPHVKEEWLTNEQRQSRIRKEEDEVIAKNLERKRLEKAAKGAATK